MQSKPTTFFIKKNSTLPIVEFSITQDILEKFNLTNDMFKNCAVTFSMFDQKSGSYKIANKAANLFIVEKEYFYLDEAKYTLQYELSSKDTNKIGVYNGEFKVDFLGKNCKKITFPKNNIVIKDYATNSGDGFEPISKETSDTFFIKQNSSLPLLEFSITQKIQEMYNLTDDMFKNCAVTFSMFDQNSGLYKIANKGAIFSIIEKEYEFLDEAKYTLQYAFSDEDTDKVGVFVGEFKIDFLGRNCGNITFQKSQIVIRGSHTKATVGFEPATNNTFDYFLNFKF